MFFSSGSRITANGNIFPQNEIKITADVSGEIVELYVKEGDPVTAGQVLAKINPREYQREVERGQAALNAAQAQLKISLDDLKKVTPSQLTTARQLVQAGELNVANAQAAVKELRSSLQRTVITARISGTISKLNVEKGERVVGTLQMAGTEMMRIADENN